MGHIGELFSRWFIETTRRLRLVVLGAAALAIILSAALWVQTILPSREFTSYRPMETKRLPNVIWIVVDALTAEDMSLFGYPLPTTPNLDRVTRDWTRFSDAQSPFTCSASALPVFLSGRYPFFNQYARYGDLMNSADGWANLAKILKDAGYETWWNGYLSPGFYHLGSSFDHLACGSSPLRMGLEKSWFLPRGVAISQFPFVPLYLKNLDLFQENREDYARCSDLSTLRNLMDQGSLKSPFFFYYHYDGVHAPYTPGPFLGSFLPVENGLVDWPSQKKIYGKVPTDLQKLAPALRLRYDEGILNQDRQLGELIDHLKATGAYDSALILVTADHGETFTGQYTSHCTPLLTYAETHVPLLIKLPGQKSGASWDRPVSTADIAPTVLEAAGFQYPASWFDGISLLKMSEDGADRIVFSLYFESANIEDTTYAAVDREYRLVHRRGQFSLYRYWQDPEEKVDLYPQAQSSSDSRLARLKAALGTFERRRVELSEGKIQVP